MIGIFGAHHRDSRAPVDLVAMIAAVPDRYVRDAPTGAGAALGRVAHRLGCGGGRAGAAAGDREVVVTGEIFNLEDFANGEEPPTDAAALILRLAEQGRLDRLADANGQFAAAIHDRRRHRLTLITDRYATHPLHLWRGDGAAVFASQLYVLIADPRVPRAADAEAVAQLFTLQRTVGEITPFAAIRALPAAAIVEIDGDRIEQRCYWRLDWRAPDFSQGEAATALAAAMRNAVACQTRSGRVGLLLSGGLDSRMVLAAAAPMPCWTTSSYAANPELAIARESAALFGAAHHASIVDPGSTLDCHDQAVVDSSGLYPASSPIAAFMPEVGDQCDAVLTGHGLDYTLRGYYLPTWFINLAGSRTRLPVMRPIAARPSGKDVLEGLRQGPPRTTIERIVPARRRDDWWSGQARRLDQVLAPWLDSTEPVNAWDGFILHSVSKHYAFSSMIAVRAEADLRMPAFDNEVFDIYLRMPPAWRVAARVAQRALHRLSPAAARLPNANTGFRADLPGLLEIAGLLGRGALRRLGVLSRPRPPTASHSTGSWQNLAGLYRHDPGYGARLRAIRGRLDSLSLGVLDADGLAACIDEHMAGQATHTKLLRQLISHDAWVRMFAVAPA